MKKLFIIPAIVLALFACGLDASAQTNNSTNNPFAMLQPVVGSGGVATLGYLVDATPYLTNAAIALEAGALKSGSHYGYFLDLQVPINTNSWQMTYGFTGAYLNKSLYSGALNVSLGTSVPIPLLSYFKAVRPAYVYVESGPGYNFRSHNFIVQSFGGVKYIQPLGFMGLPSWSAGGSYGAGIISDIKGTQQEFAGCIAFNPKGW